MHPPATPLSGISVPNIILISTPFQFGDTDCFISTPTISVHIFLSYFIIIIILYLVFLFLVQNNNNSQNINVHKATTELTRGKIMLTNCKINMAHAKN